MNSFIPESGVECRAKTSPKRNGGGYYFLCREVDENGVNEIMTTIEKQL